MSCSSSSSSGASARESGGVSLASISADGGICPRRKQSRESQERKKGHTLAGRLCADLKSLFYTPTMALLGKSQKNIDIHVYMLTFSRHLIHVRRSKETMCVSSAELKVVCACVVSF